MNVFTEIGLSNSSLVSTEFEFNDGSEIRISYHVIPYIRIWIGKRVVVISQNGFKVIRKPYRAFKCLIGFVRGVR